MGITKQQSFNLSPIRPRFQECLLMSIYCFQTSYIVISNTDPHRLNTTLASASLPSTRIPDPHDDSLSTIFEITLKPYVSRSTDQDAIASISNTKTNRVNTSTYSRQNADVLWLNEVGKMGIEVFVDECAQGITKGNRTRWAVVVSEYCLWLMSDHERWCHEMNCSKAIFIHFLLTFK